MPLPTFSADHRRELAARAGVAEQYLYQILKGVGTASPSLARRLNTYDPSLRLQDLRPEDWAEIWPELADPKPNPPPAPVPPAQAAINSVVVEVAHGY